MFLLQMIFNPAAQKEKQSADEYTHTLLNTQVPIGEASAKRACSARVPAEVKGNHFLLNTTKRQKQILSGHLCSSCLKSDI
ncbi:hypothetical protein AV530_011243 [Patagioenas fasciata monilis]|uniref:Uncharacterized protein n=1 Tax=Patagioenas fasciata monilis TaxID=372326 RepID=A0A1V4KQJ9_PATFA|nr:hypothetical protein AV530_011243 [Patagioenas fasciata monilis]